MTQRSTYLFGMVLLIITLCAPLAAQQEPIEKLRTSAEQGDADSSFELGLRYYVGNGVTLDYSEALHWLTLALDRGDSRAQSYLETLYDYNQGNQQDDITSVRSAAERGHIVSQFNLGVMYANGRNVNQDYSEAESGTG
tara:strand:+ start:7313 stop:7729 length:417 start_codon:yes stop_codon:yes gene_type:complete